MSDSADDTPDLTPAVTKPTRPLNARQEAFIREYLIDFNATQAAIRAGYSTKGAYVNGPRLLRDARIAEGIRAASLARANKTDVTIEKIIRGWEEIAYAPDPTEGTHASRVIYPRDRLKALELLARYKGLFVERQEITGKDGAPIKVMAKTWVELMREEEVD